MITLPRQTTNGIKLVRSTKLQLKCFEDKSLNKEKK